uniref:Uncharacterized protein n=1 Tax=Anopheles darlingi TaxID=43151 RepID=A0A2M4DFT4_ANODA
MIVFERRSTPQAKVRLGVCVCVFRSTLAVSVIDSNRQLIRVTCSMSFFRCYCYYMALVLVVGLDDVCVWFYRVYIFCWHFVVFPWREGVVS